MRLPDLRVGDLQQLSIFARAMYVCEGLARNLPAKGLPLLA